MTEEGSCVLLCTAVSWLCRPPPRIGALSRTGTHRGIRRGTPECHHVDADTHATPRRSGHSPDPLRLRRLEDARHPQPLPDHRPGGPPPRYRPGPEKSHIPLCQKFHRQRSCSKCSPARCRRIRVCLLAIPSALSPRDVHHPVTRKSIHLGWCFIRSPRYAPCPLR